MAYRCIEPTTLLDAGDMSEATLTSLPLKMSRILAAAFTLEWTGDAEGTFAVEGSLDGVTYTEVPDIAIDPAAGTADSRLVDISRTGLNYLRITYTKTGGTSGSLTVKGSAKGN